MNERELFLISLVQYGNIPYIWGGEGVPGYDCSGLVQALLKSLNLDPPGDQSSQALYEFLLMNGTRISKDSADLGDVAFFGNPITHVSMCLGQGWMIEAGGGDRSTTSVEIAKATNAKVRIASIYLRKNLNAVIRPYRLPWMPGTDICPKDPPKSGGQIS